MILILKIGKRRKRGTEMTSMTNIITGVSTSVLTAVCFFIGRLIREKSKGNKLSCKIDILTMRFNMIQIYQKCKDKYIRSEFDTKIFYEMYEIYTEDLKQNSYICKEIEPAFNEIKME